MIHHRVDGIISLITVMDSLGKDHARSVAVGELAKSFLLLQSGIIGVVLSSTRFHDNITKLRTGA